MDLHLVLVVHRLPLWFLIFALFLPRIAMFLAWLQGNLVPFHLGSLLPLGNLIPLIVAVLVPRILVLYLIYVDQGFSLWFLIHLVVALAVWAGSGGYHSQRLRSR